MRSSRSFIKFLALVSLIFLLASHAVSADAIQEGSEDILAFDPRVLDFAESVGIEVGDGLSPLPSNTSDLVASYDLNGNGIIDLPELFDAVDDYFAGELSIGDLFTVIDFYFSGEQVGSGPSPAQTPAPNLRHHDMKLYMLELINIERAKASVPPVTLGDNIAAQLHADNALANCFSSHWGIDGLKSYIRYSLAAGYHSNRENILGLDYCITAGDGYRAIQRIEQEIREAMDSWMDSPGHRSNILDKWHKKVNIGLAWDKYNFKAVQQFEGDYVEYDRLPVIENGILSFSGGTRNGVSFSEKRELGLQLYYDPPPHSLTLGQVSRTYCSDSGLQIAAFRYPLTGGSYWSEDEFTTTHSPCPDPYDVSPDAPPPRSPEEARRFWQEAYLASQSMPDQTITVPWITASKWTARDTGFSITSDISGLLAQYGPGVYTILLWGEMDGEDVPISEYSIFFGVEPPDTYDPGQWR